MYKKIIIAALIGGFSLSVAAKQPSVNFVQVGTTQLEHDQVTGDFTGFEVSASYGLEDNFYLIGKYVASEDLGLDMETKTIGIGYHEKVTDDSAVYVQLDAVGVVFSRPNAGQFDEQGYQFSLGYQYTLADSLEFKVGLRRLSAGEVDPAYGDYRIDYAEAGIHYEMIAGFGIYANYEEETNSKRVAFGLRYDY